MKQKVIFINDFYLKLYIQINFTIKFTEGNSEENFDNKQDKKIDPKINEEEEINKAEKEKSKNSMLSYIYGGQI